MRKKEDAKVIVDGIQNVYVKRIRECISKEIDVHEKALLRVLPANSATTHV